ncbi:uncharacterized protein At2g27730, mitochondrial [Dendrobium catenatum]|uniref:uncharacterized protein At2g27730, mitochondrial n=1 Tax=Dendrobium catenatum TaxID=906689 RepID=UPI0009F3C3CA|nr:uncharacterized protein At2g27730, mitochondrial [Dendrobium catenatum]
MAARIASRYLVRRLSSSGKVLSEEEKAAENVYIKKVEKEKLEKLARKGSKPGEDPASQSLDTTDVKPTGSPPGSSTAGVSADENRNYVVIAGAIVAISALGWYLLSKPKKSEEVSK